MLVARTGGDSLAIEDKTGGASLPDRWGRLRGFRRGRRCAALAGPCRGRTCLKAPKAACFWHRVMDAWSAAFVWEMAAMG